MSHESLCRALSHALLGTQWQPAALLERAELTLGTQKKWLRALMARICARFPGPQAPRFAALYRSLVDDDGFYESALKHHAKVHARFFTPAPMGPQRWPVPKLETDAELCAWLDLPLEHLAWLADVHGRERRVSSSTLRNYTYCWIRKRSGGWRLLEAPKSKLKELQRKILSGILAQIPVHAAAQAFRPGGSVREYVLPHIDRGLVIRMDLANFFHSIPASRVHALFHACGYPEPMARQLAGFCTNSVPTRFLRLPDQREELAFEHAQQLRTPHLPQGAPTSPMLANLCAFRLDTRLSALARKFGWTYTRYADDLLFSGNAFNPKLAQQFQIWVGAIAIEEGFRANMRKTRIMRKSTRQYAAGLVLNSKPNVPRGAFDRLKAQLFNCIQRGPQSQNDGDHPHFREHLLGRIGHVAHWNPARGAKLMKLFERINWEDWTGSDARPPVSS